MVVKLVAMDIPLDILAGLNNGDLSIGGGIRNAAGQFVTHLPKVKMPTATIESGVESAMGRFSQNATRNSLLLGLSVGLVVAGVSLGVALKKDKRETEKETQGLESQAREAIEKYNSTLSAYLIAIQSGTLTTDILDSLISALDTIKELTADGKIAVEFTREESELLVKIAYDFTLTFAEANFVEFSGIVAPTPNSVASTVDELRQYLVLQKQVFARSA